MKLHEANEKIFIEWNHGRSQSYLISKELYSGYRTNLSDNKYLGILQKKIEKRWDEEFPVVAE